MEDEKVVEVELEDEYGLEENEFKYDENDGNLVEIFQRNNIGRQALKKIVGDAKTNFIEAWDKSKGHRDKVAELWRILYCDVPPKTAPFQNCANAALPIGLTNITRLTNRVYREIFGDFSSVIRFSPTSSENINYAELCTKHSNWQIRNRIPGFKRQQHRGLMSFFGSGEAVFHSYYDGDKKCNVHELLTCDDFVIPYTHVSTATDFSDVPWLAKRMPFFKHRLPRMRKSWANVDKLIAHKNSGSSELDTELRQAIANHYNEEKSEGNLCEFVIIHYEGWIDLPSKKGYRYCQLIFDLESEIPLSFSVHEIEDQVDKARFEYQKNQAEQYRLQVEEYNSIISQKLETQEDLSDLAEALPQNSSMIGDLVTVAKQVDNEYPEPPKPVRPEWMLDDDSEPEPVNIVPIHMFSHAVCLEPMLGNHGVGIGLIYSQLNKAANTAFNQFTDAATLANGGSYISAGNLGLQTLKVGPGEINIARNVHASDLKNSIIPLNFGGANPQLIEVFGILAQQSESAGHTPAVMSGEAGKSGETARGLQSRLEQINSMIGVPAEKYGDLVIQLIKNNSKLNSLFMEESELFYLNDPSVPGEIARQQVEISREFYDNPYYLQLESDLQFKSRTDKVNEADELTQMGNSFEGLKMNGNFMHYAISQSLKARGKSHIAQTLIGPPPPGPPPPVIPPPPPPPPEPGNSQNGPKQ